MTRRRLVAKAQSKLALLSKAIGEGLSLKAAENVWWSMVIPVLNYGAEIWGATKFLEAEKLQVEAGRKLLRVSRKMSDAVVRGELGWWTMRAQRDLKRLVYWARLVRMDDTRLVKIVYRQRREQKIQRYNDWCSQVRRTLISLKLGQVWESELVGREQDWKSLVKASLRAREEADWKDQMEKKPKLRLYRTLKFALEREEYLDVVVDAQQRKILTEMRGGTNLLRVEIGRWKGEQLEERTCSFCAMGLVEDEPHALLECSASYRERRQLFSEILQSTRYDMSRMAMDQDWLLQMLLGVSCSEKNQRAAIQTLVAKFLGTLFRIRAKLLQAAQG